MSDELLQLLNVTKYIYSYLLQLWTHSSSRCDSPSIRTVQKVQRLLSKTINYQQQTSNQGWNVTKYISIFCYCKLPLDDTPEVKVVLFLLHCTSEASAQLHTLSSDLTAAGCFCSGECGDVWVHMSRSR